MAIAKHLQVLKRKPGCLKLETTRGLVGILQFFDSINDLRLYIRLAKESRSRRSYGFFMIFDTECMDWTRRGITVTIDLTGTRARIQTHFSQSYSLGVKFQNISLLPPYARPCLCRLSMTESFFSALAVIEISNRCLFQAILIHTCHPVICHSFGGQD